ncbi:MAG: hypothetical protein PWQ98_1118 [Moorella sp. (in: firmicutes)]|jgi:hypothetical protein|nr:hypothetical protein [Moorella sp. (in: firmicutes)]
MKLRDLLILEARLNEEKENLERLKKTLQARGFWATPQQEISLRQADEFTLRALASVLLDYYIGIENMFEEIAKAVDGSLPSGQEWHKDLLRQMKLDINGIRPAVITRTTFALLDEYRKFRHLVRNIYGFNLIPERLEPLLNRLPEVDQRLKNEVDGFIKQMYEIIRRSVN